MSPSTSAEASSSDPRGRREEPWPFRAVALIVATIAGIFGLVLLVGALGPRVATDVTTSVQASLVLPDDTALPELRERSFVYAADGSLLTVLHDEIDRRVVDIDQVPDHVWQAVLTAEDRRFFEHDGYDVEGMGRALVTNLQARGITQGGSTITQQLAKNNFLDASQTIDRKFTELLYAMALENEMSKEELLERYLNQVYFGHGAYGVQAAAEEYFGVDAAELEPQQSALLAGFVRAPALVDPRSDPDSALERRNRVLATMVSEGYLDEDEAEQAREADLGVIDSAGQETLEPYVVEAVKRQVLDDPAFGETREERSDMLFGGGLEMHTTIEPDLQEVAREVVDDHFPDPAPTAAIASIEPDSGAVVAMHSGDDFDAEQFDLALQGRKQPGSAFKTFVMVEALRQGFPVELTLEADSPMEFFDPDMMEEPWEVGNYGGTDHGHIDLREATQRSVNTYFAQLADIVGIEEVKELTDGLGVSREAYGGFAGLAAISIGGLERGVTPVEMASAYATFANEGERAQPYLLARVERNGEDIWEHEAEAERVVEEVPNAVAVELLQDAVEDGTGGAAQIDGWDVAGKTGTTNSNFAVWFAGFTPKLSTAVWVGHPERDVRMPETTGGDTAAPVWYDFMVEALERYEPESFPEVDDDALAEFFEGHETHMPGVVGLQEDRALRALGLAKLRAEVEERPSGAPEGTVVRQSPRAGEALDIGEEVVIEVSTGQRPAPPSPPPSEPSPPPSQQQEPTPAPSAEPAPEPAPEPSPEPAPEPAPEQAPEEPAQSSGQQSGEQQSGEQQSGDQSGEQQSGDQSGEQQSGEQQSGGQSGEQQSDGGAAGAAQQSTGPPAEPAPADVEEGSAPEGGAPG